MSATIIDFPSRSTPGGSPASSTLAGMSARRKAAVVLLSLPRDQATAILAELDEFELESMYLEIATVGVISAETSAEVLAEFAAAVATAQSSGISGGIDTAHDLLAASVGQDRASSITDRITSQLESSLPFAFLRDFDARQIATALYSEHPQTVALVLAHLPADLAAAILAGLDPTRQVAIAHRIAIMDRTSPDLIKMVEAGLKRDLYSSGVSAEESAALGGVQPLVDIMNRTDRATERTLLEDLRSIDDELAESVRAQMFTFEDIAGLDDRSIQLVVRRVAVGDMALALKGVDGGVREAFARNMSSRTAEMLKEEYEALGKVRASAVSTAQTEVIRHLRQLEEEGEIVVARSGSGDQFIA